MGFFDELKREAKKAFIEGMRGKELDDDEDIDNISIAKEFVNQVKDEIKLKADDDAPAFTPAKNGKEELKSEANENDDASLKKVFYKMTITPLKPELYGAQIFLNYLDQEYYFGYWDKEDIYSLFGSDRFFSNKDQKTYDLSVGNFSGTRNAYIEDRSKFYQLFRIDLVDFTVKVTPACFKESSKVLKDADKISPLIVQNAKKSEYVNVYEHCQPLPSRWEDYFLKPEARCLKYEQIYSFEGKKNDLLTFMEKEILSPLTDLNIQKFNLTVSDPEVDKVFGTKRTVYVNTDEWWYTKTHEASTQWPVLELHLFKNGLGASIAGNESLTVTLIKRHSTYRAIESKPKQYFDTCDACRELIDLWQDILMFYTVVGFEKTEKMGLLDEIKNEQPPSEEDPSVISLFEGIYLKESYSTMEFFGEHCVLDSIIKSHDFLNEDDAEKYNLNHYRDEYDDIHCNASLTGAEIELFTIMLDSQEYAAENPNRFCSCIVDFPANINRPDIIGKLSENLDFFEPYRPLITKMINCFKKKVNKQRNDDIILGSTTVRYVFYGESDKISDSLMEMILAGMVKKIGEDGLKRLGVDYRDLTETSFSFCAKVEPWYALNDVTIKGDNVLPNTEPSTEYTICTIGINASDKKEGFLELIVEINCSQLGIRNGQLDEISAPFKAVENCLTTTLEYIREHS